MTASRMSDNTMKLSFVRSTLFAMLCVFLCPPVAGHASSPPADSTHVCAFDEHQQWRRDHPQPAAKRLADLNVGEPRTVRMIYFLPNDWSYRAEVVDSMKTVIKESQTFYAEQMQAHDYGNDTFRIEADANGEPLVHRVDGQHPFSHYDNTLGTAVVAELEQTFDLDANIYFIVLGTDALRQGNGQPVRGVGRRRTKNGGHLVVPDQFSFFTVAHELGHTFGLRHDFRDDRYIMSYGARRMSELSACAAEFLAVNPYLNPAIPIEEGQPPTVEILSSDRYQAGSTSVPVRVRVSDSEGLHQVGLIGTSKWCRGLTGDMNAVVEFNCDGTFWSDGFFDLDDEAKHNLLVVAVDTEGNVSETHSSLTEISPYEIAVLRGELDQIQSVAFSPAGAILAAASYGSVLLWDASTRERIGALEGTGGRVVAFSPDGGQLAIAGGGIQLWDVANRKKTATLTGHTGWVNSVSYSPGGALLASGSADSTVKLWDIASRKEIVTLKGHTDQVRSVAYSPGGALLASGSADSTVKLWDVASRKEIVTLKGHTSWITSVAFSPDGTTLASGVYNGGVTLWDVTSREEVAYLYEGGSPVAFSPDGSTLFYARYDAITLWDVATEKELTTLTGVSPDVSSMSLSPDGTTLASGTWSDGTITLWDVSEWAVPRPFALEVVSGDGQQGPPGAALTQPLVVEVRDQYGDLLPDAAVTFTVTVGDGKLSGRFTVEHATTDADGRAELTLILGPHPGPNVVKVSLSGRKLATFAAEGVGVAVVELAGDYRTWHLPAGATVRLGKGAMGESDRAVALSADGRCLAVASGIGVWLYEAATTRLLALLPSARPVQSVAWSLDGTLAAGLDNGRVELWAVETGERVGTLRHVGWGRVTVVFSPDGTRLASGSLSRIRLWDVETRREVATWEVPDMQFVVPTSVVFSPDGTRLASNTLDSTVRLWDVATQTEVARLEGHTAGIHSVTFSPDGALLASGGSYHDPTVRLWDVATQRQVAILRGPIHSVIKSVSFSSPDGALLAAGSTDNTVRLWDVATHEEVAILEEHVAGILSVTYSGDGATLISGAADGTVLLRDEKTGSAAGLSGHAFLFSMSLSPDGAILASAGGWNDPTVKLWDVKTRKLVETLEGHTGSVLSLSFSPDGGLLVSAGGWDDPTVRLWDVKTRKLVKTLRGHTENVYSLSFSPDGALLASAGGSNDSAVRLWDVGKRELVGILEGHTENVYSLSFSPDGALLATGSWDETVKLWDVVTRSSIATVQHPSRVYSMAFSPDGEILASGSRDGTVRLWDVGTREQIGILDGHTNEVFSVAFSPDGALLATGDETVKLWDVERREQIGALQGHTSSVHSLAFSHDDSTLASGASDGTVLLWDIASHLNPRTPDPDFDGNGTVGFTDFVQFAAQFGLSQGDEGYDARYDLDSNGTIGFSDFLIFASAFGKEG